MNKYVSSLQNKIAHLRYIKGSNVIKHFLAIGVVFKDTEDKMWIITWFTNMPSFIDE